MYLIVTDNEEFANQAKRMGMAVFSSECQESSNKQGVLEKNVDAAIKELLSRLVIRPDLNGYEYLKFIARKCANDSGYHRLSLTKVVYPECAKHFDTTASGVERGIRHAVQIAYAKFPHEYNEFFKKELTAAPVNSEVISMISIYLS